MTATVIRIKRRLDVDPSDAIVISAKRIKVDENCDDTAGAAAYSSDSKNTILKHVATVNSNVRNFFLSHLFNILK